MSSGLKWSSSLFEILYYIAVASTLFTHVIADPFAKGFLDFFWEDVTVEFPPKSPVEETDTSYPPLTPYNLKSFRKGRDLSLATQFSNEGVGKNFLNKVAEYSINETRYLVQIQEPRIFRKGQFFYFLNFYNDE